MANTCFFVKKFQKEMEALEKKKIPRVGAAALPGAKGQENSTKHF